MSVQIGLGEYRVGRTDPNEWVIHGLGSCIGLILSDLSSKVSALAHVVLPYHPSSSVERTAKYGDIVVPFLVEKMCRLGTQPGSIVAQIAGGAKMLQLGMLGDIGARNIESVKRSLAAESIPLVAAQVGGTQGRTLRWDPTRGRAIVRSVGGVDEILTPVQYVFKEVDGRGVGFGGG